MPSGNLKKYAVVTFRVTRREKFRLKTLSETVGMTWSDFLRNSLVIGARVYSDFIGPWDASDEHSKEPKPDLTALLDTGMTKREEEFYDRPAPPFDGRVPQGSIKKKRPRGLSKGKTKRKTA